MSVITLTQAKAHLRVVVIDTNQDALIQDYIDAAEAYASAYLDRTFYVDSDALADAVIAGQAGSDPMVINSSIKAACYLMIGNLYANREAVVDSRAAVEMPLGVKQLLDPFRILGL